MIVCHVVVLKPKPGIAVEEIQSVLEQVKELQPIIPDMLDIRVGNNFANPDNYGYSQGFIMRFSDGNHM